jgi:hypothetical protein
MAIRHAMETAGVEFIDENGGGPGVRLRKSLKVKNHKSALVRDCRTACLPESAASLKQRLTFQPDGKRHA